MSPRAPRLNQALDTIDVLLQLEVQGIQNDPPGSASDGDRYLVGTGDWTGEDGKLARFMADPGYWQFFSAKVVLNRVEGLLYLHTASGWQPCHDYSEYQRRFGRGGRAEVGCVAWGVLG